MDLNRLISKIREYTGKDLKFSMREFQQLQLLRDDVKKLEEIMGYSSENPAALLEHYRSHALELQRYSERVERRLNVWIERLEGLITEEEQKLTARDKQYFELWKNKVNICKKNLVRLLAKGGELHKLVNEQSPNWKVEIKIDEALGDNQHPGLRTLIVLFQQLEQVEDKLGKVITPEGYQQRLEQLKKWGFPVETELQLADFLVKHWSGTIKMIKGADGTAILLFKGGLPAVKDIINERTWPGMVEMVKATRYRASSLFQWGLPAVEHLINERTWPVMVEMAKATGLNALPLFQFGLPAVEHLIKEKNLINERNLQIIGKDLVKMANAAGLNAGLLFQFGLPAAHIIKSYEDWQIMVKFVASIAPSKQKVYLLSYMSRIPPSVIRAFYDFILVVMDKQPARMLNIITYVRALAELNVSIRNEILQFAKIVGAFRLNPREYPSERIKQSIRNTYIFLAQQTMKKNIENKLRELDKDIEKLSNQNAKIRQAAMDKINAIITPLIVEYLGHITTNKFEEAWRSFTGISVNKDIEKRHFDDLLFALQIAIRSYRPEAKLFLEQVSLGKFYPEKNLPNCFPYDQPKSMAFIAEMERRGINMVPWLYGFERVLDVRSKAEAEHQAQLIEQNVQEALQHFNELGVQTTKEDMGEALNKINDNPNKAIVQDIKQHLQAIKSFEGGVRAIKGVTTAKVYIELNPLKVLQMGEKVNASCLALNGGHARDTITNAIDINKRVVWAEHNGRILGRVLLAMNEDGEILQYMPHYAFIGIDLGNTFNAFVEELAKACHTKTSTTENVSLILASAWYAGSQPE